MLLDLYLKEAQQLTETMAECWMMSVNDYIGARNYQDWSRVAFTRFACNTNINRKCHF